MKTRKVLRSVTAVARLATEAILNLVAIAIVMCATSVWAGYAIHLADRNITAGLVHFAAACIAGCVAGGACIRFASPEIKRFAWGEKYER